MGEIAREYEELMEYLKELSKENLGSQAIFIDRDYSLEEPSIESGQEIFFKE